MKLTKIILFVLIPLMFVSCVTLEPVSVTRNAPLYSLYNYTYFYITPTETKVSGYGGIYGNFALYESKSTNPADVISGYLIKRGMVRLPEVKSDLLEKTMIINYSETGRRQTSLGGYTIEITLQVLSAKTNEVLCVITGEGKGSTEADDIRIAINRCLDEMYK